MLICLAPFAQDRVPRCGALLSYHTHSRLSTTFFKVSFGFNREPLISLAPCEVQLDNSIRSESLCQELFSKFLTGFPILTVPRRTAWLVYRLFPLLSTLFCIFFAFLFTRPEKALLFIIIYTICFPIPFHRMYISPTYY